MPVFYPPRHVYIASLLRSFTISTAAASDDNTARVHRFCYCLNSQTSPSFPSPAPLTFPLLIRGVLTSLPVDRQNFVSELLFAANFFSDNVSNGRKKRSSRLDAQEVVRARTQEVYTSGEHD